MDSFTLQYGMWLWDDRTLNSSGGSIVQCNTWLWDHDIEFDRWQQPAM